uniref:Uncharacterized protein n=1 Tax=uncultured prokaryote TaxID=198431 RepID=A0A0H5QM69_9ZZZZ|nr:hypothetical protein [uncultured prokaryote]
MEKTVRADWLFAELDRLCERYAGEPVAVEALDAVRYWVIEETVEKAAGR